MAVLNKLRRVPLGDIYWFQEGPGVRNWQFTDSGIKLLNVANIEKSGVLNLNKTNRYLSAEEVESRYRHFLVDAGDLVIASSGISFDVDGMLRTRGAFVDDSHLPLCLNTSTIRFKAKAGISDLGYLKHWLDSLEFREEITKRVTGSAQQNFGPSHLKLIEISLPPLDEQRRIATILDQADALRVKRREALAQMDNLMQSIFVEIFRDTLACNSRVALRDYIEEFRYGTSNKSGTEGYPALRIPNVTSGSLDLQDLKTVEVDDAELQRLKLRDGDLLFVRTNGNPDNVGRCAVFNSLKVSGSGFDSSEFIYASYLIRARLKSGTVLPVVLQQYLSFGEGRQALRARSKTSAGQFNINTEGLGTLPIPSFSMSLQEAFIERKEAIEWQQTIQRSSLVELDNLFVSLQNRAFRGEL